mmetsp:Transcript_12839/g.46928  ORF Transcript_12839/g.46928 Transcript_12839/m.46928 type:complete len:223 (+) Transcript_12839:1726-2394(+)
MRPCRGSSTERARHGWGSWRLSLAVSGGSRLPDKRQAPLMTLVEQDLVMLIAIQNRFRRGHIHAFDRPHMGDQVRGDIHCPLRLDHDDLCARVVLQRLKVLHVGLQLLLLLCDSVRGPPALLEALHLHDLQPHKLAGFLVRLQRFDRIRRRNRHVGAEGAKQELRLQVTAVLAEIGRFLVRLAVTIYGFAALAFLMHAYVYQHGRELLLRCVEGLQLCVVLV